MNHPCNAGPNGTPCNRVRIGQAYDIKCECRMCWLFHHVEAYNRLWGGDGQTVDAPGAANIQAMCELASQPAPT